MPAHRFCLATLVVAAVMLSGCTTARTGVLPAGAPDTYRITERDSALNGGAVTAQFDTTAQALAFCHARGRMLVPVRVDQFSEGLGAIIGPTGVTMTFRCAAANAAAGQAARAAPGG